MEKERLIERLNFVMGKKDCLALAAYFAEMDGGVETLFDLCCSKNETSAFHSAWVLENVLTSNPDIFALSLDKIVELFPETKNPSVQRHFSKLLSLGFTACSKNQLPKDACQLLKKLDMEPVVEKCFELLMEPTTKAAVKVHCMDILAHLSQRYLWVADELPHVIKLQMLTSTPALAARGRKVIEAMRKAGLW